MCDPENPLGSQVFDTSEGTPYAGSNINNYLRGAALANFNTVEKDLMKNPTLSADGSAPTSEKLYLASGSNQTNFITVGMNDTKIGLKNNGPSGGSPYTDSSIGSFWLRDMYMSIDATLACPGGCTWTGDNRWGVTDLGMNHSYNVVPAFNLDMTNVLLHLLRNRQLLGQLWKTL